LLIDLAVLRQAYRKYDLDDVGFIRSAYNPADCLTKEVRECMLLTVLKTGKLTHPVDEYIQRNQDANRAEASVGNSVNLSIFYGSAW
jgi:adenine deaminase